MYLTMDELTETADTCVVTADFSYERYSRSSNSKPVTSHSSHMSSHDKRIPCVLQARAHPVAYREAAVFENIRTMT